MFGMFVGTDIAFLFFLQSEDGMIGPVFLVAGLIFLVMAVLVGKEPETEVKAEMAEIIGLFGAMFWASSFFLMVEEVPIGDLLWWSLLKVWLLMQISLMVTVYVGVKVRDRYYKRV